MKPRASIPATFSILRAGQGLHQLVHRAPERPRVAEQRGDVAEQDSGLGVVGNRADEVGQVVHGETVSILREPVASSGLQELSSGIDAGGAVC